MSLVFADTSFWIALVNPRDQHHERAIAAKAQHSQDKLLTTEAVIIEFFNFYSSAGSFWRRKVHEYYDALRQS